MANEKRLIDANALLEDAELYPTIRMCLADIVDIERLVKDQPTVDAVEVVHGHWTGKIICGGFAEEWGYKCSICGCTVSERSGLGVYQDRNQQLNYCPNCGAKMDGERRTNERKTD